MSGNQASFNHAAYFAAAHQVGEDPIVLAPGDLGGPDGYVTPRAPAGCEVILDLARCPSTYGPGCVRLARGIVWQSFKRHFRAATTLWRRVGPRARWAAVRGCCGDARRIARLTSRLLTGRYEG